MASDESLKELLHELEQRLLQPEVRHSPAELVQLLAEEFVEFASSGRVFDRESIIDALSKEPPVRITITDFKTVRLAQDVVLATLLALFFDGERKPPKRSLRSSIWKRTGGSWQMIFHQGTPAATP